MINKTRQTESDEFCHGGRRRTQVANGARASVAGENFPERMVNFLTGWWGEKLAAASGKRGRDVDTFGKARARR
jgi:hypothetical protein